MSERSCAPSGIITAKDRPFKIIFHNGRGLTASRYNEPTLDRALQLLNGAEVRQRIVKSNAKYGKLKPDAFVTELYLVAFSRTPSQKERTTARQFLKTAKNRADALRDLVWAIINTQEFLLQH